MPQSNSGLPHGPKISRFQPQRARGRCSIEYKIPQLPAQRRFVAEEASYHRLEESRRIQPRELEGMASFCREQRGEGQLRSSIAFAERVDRIQVGKERGASSAKAFASFPLRRSAPCKRANSARISPAMFSGKQKGLRSLVIRTVR